MIEKIFICSCQRSILNKNTFDKKKLNIFKARIFKEKALGRFVHRLAMSVCLFVCLFVCPSRASHWPSVHMIRSRPLIGRPPLPPPSSMDWCRASIAHAWSPKNKGLVQSVHSPRVGP